MLIKRIGPDRFAYDGSETDFEQGRHRNALRCMAELDGYMDFERYGQDCMDKDHVIQTEFGLLRRLEPSFPEQSQTQQMKGL